MERKNESSPLVTFSLCIGHEVFEKESFLAYRPIPGETFTVLRIKFICRNLRGMPFKGEPVIGELVSGQSLAECRQILLENSFMQLEADDAKEIFALGYPLEQPTPEPESNECNLIIEGVSLASHAQMQTRIKWCWLIANIVAAVFTVLGLKTQHWEWGLGVILTLAAGLIVHQKIVQLSLKGHY